MKFVIIRIKDKYYIKKKYCFFWWSYVKYSNSSDKIEFVSKKQARDYVGLCRLSC